MDTNQKMSMAEMNLDELAAVNGGIDWGCDFGFNWTGAAVGGIATTVEAVHG